MSGELAFYIAACVAAFLVGASKGGLPLVGGLSVPVMALVMSPVTAAALLLPVYLVSDVFGLWAYRREFDRRNLMILIPATSLGILIGWAAARVTQEWMVTLLVGVIGISFCINALLKRHNAAPRPADVPRGLFWGTIAGFTSFVSHNGAPPYQMYALPQKLPKMVFAGTSTILFAYVNAAKLLPYWALGQFNPGNLEVAAIIAPVSIAGALTGYKLTSILPEKIFFRLVEVTLAVVSVKLIFDALFKAS